MADKIQQKAALAEKERQRLQDLANLPHAKIDPKLLEGFRRLETAEAKAARLKQEKADKIAARLLELETRRSVQNVTPDVEQRPHDPRDRKDPYFKRMMNTKTGTFYFGWDPMANIYVRIHDELVGENLEEGFYPGDPKLVDGGKKKKTSITQKIKTALDWVPFKKYMWWNYAAQAVLRPYDASPLTEFDSFMARMVKAGYNLPKERAAISEGYTRNMKYDSKYVSVWDRDNHRIIVVRGTKPSHGKDWYQNAKIAYKGRPEDLVSKLMKQIVDETDKNSRIVIAAHSLGTSLALEALNSNPGLKDRIDQTFLFNPAYTLGGKGSTSDYEKNEKFRYFLNTGDIVSMGSLGGSGPLNYVLQNPSSANPLKAHTIDQWMGDTAGIIKKQGEAEAERKRQQADQLKKDRSDPNVSAEMDNFIKQLGELGLWRSDPMTNWTWVELDSYLDMATDPENKEKMDKIREIILAQAKKKGDTAEEKAAKAKLEEAAKAKLEEAAVEAKRKAAEAAEEAKRKAAEEAKQTEKVKTKTTEEYNPYQQHPTLGVVKNYLLEQYGISREELESGKITKDKYPYLSYDSNQNVTLFDDPSIHDQYHIKDHYAATTDTLGHLHTFRKAWDFVPKFANTIPNVAKSEKIITPSQPKK